MSVALQLGLALGSVVVLLAVMALVRKFAGIGGLGPEVQRKLVHMGTGLYAIALPWIFTDRWPVYALIGLTLLVMLVLRSSRLSAGLGATLHGVERRSYGDFMLAIGVGLTFFLADGDPLLYTLPILILTLADAAAALAGTTYGTRRFRVESGEKSIEGGVAFFVVTLLISMTLLMFLTKLPPANILALAVMVAGFGTLVEAQSWRGFDNIFLPVGVLIFLVGHLQSSLPELIWFGAQFLIGILGFMLIGPLLGLTRHASRVYVVAVFLILVVTEAQNAVLPCLVLLAHAWAAARQPSQDPYGELDVVTALALVSFGWLALGNALGDNALGFYGLSMMGMVMGLACVALRGWWPGVLAVAGLLFGLREAVAILNPPQANWSEPLWVFALLSLGPPVAVYRIAPQQLTRDRVLKLTLIALPVPLLVYLFLVFGL